MKIVRHGKSQKDKLRFRRYMDLLQGCKTAEECLLKSCSYSDSDHSSSAKKGASAKVANAMDVDNDDLHLGEACETMITTREEQKKALVAELKHHLLHAAWLEQQCQRAPDPLHRGTHYLQWKSEINRNGLKDPTATADILAHFGVALGKVDATTEDRYYRDPPTKEELEREKVAADLRKKRDKAKRTADRKAKNSNEGKPTSKASKVSKSTAGQNEDPAEMVVSESESMHADGKDADDQEPKPGRIPHADSETYASTLRSLTAQLRGLVTEFTSRTRSLRLAHGAKQLLLWYGKLGKPPSCDACGEVTKDLDAMSINIRCGHITCDDCILRKALVVCAVNGCEEGSESFCLRKAVDIAGDGRTGTYGSRLDSIIALINSLPEEDQALLFVQFEDVMHRMASGLEAAGISNHALSIRAGRGLVDMMNDFQDNHGETRKRVLLLNPADETSSGM